jgi:glycosyltransferase involved in cell wall biosynthesis
VTAVSVVIATYRRREACRAAIQSALDQTYPVLEVLVCDDGSDDGTIEMVRQCAADDPRVSAIAAAGHAGRPAPARNRGIHAARGDWIAFLDDDDVWFVDKLERQAPWLNGDADVVAANAISVDGELYFPNWKQSRRFGVATLRRTNPVILSSAVARRALLLEVGGFPEDPWLAGIEDYALWLEVGLRGGRFVASPDPLVRYESGGTAARLSTRIVANEVAVSRLLWRVSRARPRDRAIRRAALSKTSYAMTIARDRWLGRS